MPQNRFPGDDVTTAAWAVFDTGWYARRYLPDASNDEALTHYVTQGARAGYSPNPFFDEKWYRLRHPEVAAAIAQGNLISGFADYCRNPDDARSPHWLFDAGYCNAGGSQPAGYVNAYDHFLKLGDGAGHRPSVFFHAPTLLGTMRSEEQRHARRAGCFHHVVSRFSPEALEARFSPYFDPVWYLRHNPAAAAAILRGRVPSALAHYLLYRTDVPLDPVEQFSESYYLAQHADVAMAVQGGALPCGYAHFLQFGIAEGRRFHPDISPDLAGEPQAGSRDCMPDAFARFVMTGPAPTPSLAEDQAKQLFRDKASHAARAAASEVLDFTCGDRPAVSVIMVLHNKLDLTLAVLGELQDHMSGRLELILVDSGSTDETLAIGQYVQGARLIRFEENINFVHACNAGLATARGQAILYLNNDVRLGPRAVDRAFRRLNSAPEIGAVGGMVIRSHGLLQEAGCIIWRDGFTDGYLRDGSPLLPEANFVRDVDFCSGVFLMLRRDLAVAMGGFDTAYSPAYFEETDLCVRLRQSGWRVVYDPSVRVEHLEYGSATAARDAVGRIQANQRIFASKHADWLSGQPDRIETRIALARIPREARGKKRILMIEDQLPIRSLGSGFVRSNDIAQVMAAEGYLLTIYPIYPPHGGPQLWRRDFPDTVEVIDDRGAADLPAFLVDRAGYYDHIWIGRTHNLDRLAALLADLRRNDGPNIILDTEAVAALRTQQSAALEGQILDLSAAIRHEFRNIGLADRVVSVNTADADLIRQAVLAEPAILGHMRRSRASGPGHDTRRDLLFVGAMHGNDAPNLDALTWFVDHVLDVVVAQLGSDIRLTVIGHTDPGVDISRFAGHPNLRLLGGVPDIGPHYDSHRVFVAPTRIAGGMPYKLHEAASEGIPIVATDLLAQQMGWRDGQDLLAVDKNDAEAFAAAVVRAYQDAALWNALRRSALARIEREASPDTYAEKIREILI